MRPASVGRIGIRGLVVASQDEAVPRPLVAGSSGSGGETALSRPTGNLSDNKSKFLNDGSPRMIEKERLMGYTKNVRGTIPLDILLTPIRVQNDFGCLF